MQQCLKMGQSCVSNLSPDAFFIAKTQYLNRTVDELIDLVRC